MGAGERGETLPPCTLDWKETGTKYFRKHTGQWVSVAGVWSEGLPSGVGAVSD